MSFTADGLNIDAVGLLQDLIPHVPNVQAALTLADVSRDDRIRQLFVAGNACFHSPEAMQANAPRVPDIECALLPILPDMVLPYQRGTVAAMLVQECIATNRGAFIPHGADRVLSVSSACLWSTDAPPYNTSGGILWSPPGSGKTAMMLALIKVTQLATLVVVPSQLVRQWANEARRFGVSCALMYGSRDYEAGALCTITSYETFVSRFGIVATSVPAARVVFDEGSEKGAATAAVQLAKSLLATRTWVLTASILGRRHRYRTLLTLDNLLRSHPRHGPCATLRSDGTVHPVDCFSLRANDAVASFSLEDTETVLHCETRSAGSNYESGVTQILDVVGRLSWAVLRGPAPPRPFVHHLVVEITQDTTQTQAARTWWGASRNLHALSILRLGLNFRMTADELIDRLQVLLPSDQRDTANQRVFSDAESMIQSMGGSTYIANQVSIVQAREEPQSCPICLDAIDWADLVMSECGHVFHNECAARTLRSGQCWCRHKFPDKSVVFRLSTDAQPPETHDTPTIRHFSHIIDTLEPTQKLEAAISLSLEHAHTPHLVFCEHALTAQFVATRLAQLHTPGKVRALYGRVGIHRKQKIIQDFQGGGFDVLVLTYKSGGVGANFQRAARIIMLDTPLFQQEYEQAVGRVQREGQTADCITVTRITTSDTVETNMPFHRDDGLTWDTVRFVA